MTTLTLLEPAAPRPTWLPFAGVRPIAELRAGVWKIRERWEAALDLETSAIMGDHIAHFHEGFEPRCIPLGPVTGPAIVVASWFAPTGGALVLRPETRRLTATSGDTVGWVVPAGATWGEANDVGPAQTLDGLLLRGTWDLLAALDRFLPNDCLGFQAGPRDPVPAAAVVLGDPSLILTHQAIVEPGVVFDTRLGAIVLEPGVEVRHGTRLEGPLYAGNRTRLLGDHLRASVFGPRCNVKGEVSNVVFTGYGNKGHDGFLGHSVLGHWVNLGAGTTTSNLKNTYGEVALELEGTRVPTGRQFLGTLFGDHAKTAIGTMLPTGTVVGAGASVFGSGALPKEIAPFAWGLDGERLHEAGFLTIAERVMPRRDVAFTAERRAALSATWRLLSGA